MQILDQNAWSVENRDEKIYLYLNKIPAFYADENAAANRNFLGFSGASSLVSSNANKLLDLLFGFGESLPPEPPEPELLFAIDCGRTTGGTVGGWSQDNYFVGGNVISSWTSPPYDFTNGDEPPPNLVLHSIRYGGDMIYTFIGLENVPHKVRLHFAEADGSSRVLNCFINAVKVLDLYSTLPVSSIVVWDVQEFNVTPTSNQIVISFEGSPPIISGIEIIKL